MRWYTDGIAENLQAPLNHSVLVQALYRDGTTPVPVLESSQARREDKTPRQASLLQGRKY